MTEGVAAVPETGDLPVEGELILFNSEKTVQDAGGGVNGLVASRLQGARALREGKLLLNATEGVIISSVAYTLFVLFPNEFGYYGSALLLGLGNGHLWPAFQNMIISMAHHNERGTANSTLLISWDVGIGLGVLCGGVVSELAGYTSAFWVVAISQLVGAALFLLATRTFYQKRQL